jgi:hypothetical protein
MKKILFSLLALVLVSLTTYSQEKRAFFDFTITIETDLIKDHGDGCYEIQVRVVYTCTDTGSFVETWANVMVGNCDHKQFIPQHNNLSCDDLLYNGDYIINSEYPSKKCFVEYLKDDSVYQKYTEAKERLIASIQK